MLNDYPKVRKYAYIVFSILALAIGAFQVGYNSLSLANPDWLTVAISVVPFVGAQLGLIALSNIDTKKPITSTE